MSGLAAAAPAQRASMVFVKKGDVWMSRPDGSRQIAVTKDGRPGNPYFSPSIADNGTIEALKGIHLHSFRPSGQRIIKPRQWAILGPKPSRSEWTSPPTAESRRPTTRCTARTTTRAGPRTGPRWSPASSTSSTSGRTRPTGTRTATTTTASARGSTRRRVITTSHGIFNAQLLAAPVGTRTRGRDFYRDPARDPNTGTNSYILADAELTRARDKFAVMRRPLQGSDIRDLSPATIQIYDTGNPTTDSRPLCSIGPGRQIGPDADPSWAPDGRTLVWWESGRGIFSTPVTSAPGCGLRPRRIVRGGLTPDLSRASVPRRQ